MVLKPIKPEYQEGLEKELNSAVKATEKALKDASVLDNIEIEEPDLWDKEDLEKFLGFPGLRVSNVDVDTFVDYMEERFENQYKIIMTKAPLYQLKPRRRVQGYAKEGVGAVVSTFNINERETNKVLTQEVGHILGLNDHYRGKCVMRKEVDQTSNSFCKAVVRN